MVTRRVVTMLGILLLFPHLGAPLGPGEVILNIHQLANTELHYISDYTTADMARVVPRLAEAEVAVFTYSLSTMVAKHKASAWGVCPMFRWIMYLLSIASICSAGHGAGHGDDHGDDDGDDHSEDQGEDHGDDHGEDHGDEHGNAHGDDHGNDNKDGAGDGGSAWGLPMYLKGGVTVEQVTVVTPHLAAGAGGHQLPLHRKLLPELFCQAK